LSYGADARLQMHPSNPFELGLGKLIDLDNDHDFIGKQALLEIRETGVKRQFCGFFIDGSAVAGNPHSLPIHCAGERVGYISEMVYSPRLKRNIALGLLANNLANDAALEVLINAEPRSLAPAALPFIPHR
jgi:aminomethyltransferase